MSASGNVTFSHGCSEEWSRARSSANVALVSEIGHLSCTHAPVREKQ